MVYVAILGHGVVGSGVAEVLRKNADSIAHNCLLYTSDAADEL